MERPSFAHLQGAGLILVRFNQLPGDIVELD